MRTQRIEEMESYIFDCKTVTLDHLCEEFNVSKNTIRRDIDRLVDKGCIKKIYGGVTINNAASPSQELISFDERNVSNLEIKDQIAKRAAELVNDGDVIFIDSGTTTNHLLNYITNRNNLTIITHSLEVILNTIAYDNINVISLSGTLNRKTLSFTGASTTDIINNYNITKAFLSTTGLSIENGATNSSPGESSIKRAAVSRSQQLYLLADHTKFNVVSLMTYCPLEKFNGLVTDQRPPEPLNEFLHTNNVTLYYS